MTGTISVEILTYCCTNNGNKSCQPKEYFQQHCHILLRYLDSFIHTSFNHQIASMWFHGCHQQTCIPPTLLMVTGPSLWSTNVNYHQICWWHRILLHQCTVMDAVHYGGRTEIFSSKATEPETSRSVKKRSFYLSHRHFSDFRRDLLQNKTSPSLSCSTVCTILHLAIMLQPRLVTDGWTDMRWQQIPV